MNKKLALASVLGLGFCTYTYAGITVNPMLAFFTDQTKIQDITVSNSADTTAYVEVIPKYMQNVGTSSEKAVTYQAGSDVSSFGLMASPLKLAIPANSTRKVRLVFLKSGITQDAVYYVNFLPIASLSGDATQSGSFQFTNQISYSVQAVALPVNPAPKVSLVRQGQTITVTNSGNSYASLRNGQICNAQGSSCQALPSATSYKVLYAGNTWTFTAPSAGVVQFTMVYNQNKSAQVSSN